ncbi:MAG: hypothetical protein DHS80DRAFT_13949, partial [Piptocephalis tieghemiana]
CAECGQVIEGRMVRALGAAYHLQCFRCAECGIPVAQRFFPVESPPSSSSSSSSNANSKNPTRRPPLLLLLLLLRLDLICATCNGALRSSYITALDKKYHMNHFTCSACATVFGPQDSYYEHDGHVYCHYHFSIRFAGKCVGCRYPILKQFVEINKQPPQGPYPPSSSSPTPPSTTPSSSITLATADEHWHPECYMINKFWNVRLASSARNKALDKEPQVISPQAIKRLKFEQEQMEERVYQIWTVLSAFEESSAACISQMLLDVSGGAYLEGVRMSASFIQHVEVLFAAVDRLERQLGRFGDSTGLPHTKEPKFLCKNIIHFFTLLSQTQEGEIQRLSSTKDLITLVTGLAHYLKNLIRIGLKGALRMENEHGSTTTISAFLSKLMELEEYGEDDLFGPCNTREEEEAKARAFAALTDRCAGCQQTLEEQCVRSGPWRWHDSCLMCVTCGVPLVLGREERHAQRQIQGSPPPPSSSALTDHAKFTTARFTRVSQLKQYVFLLRVAQQHLILKLMSSQKGLSSDPSSPFPSSSSAAGGMRGPGPSDHPSSSQRPNHPNTSSSTSTTTSRRRGRDEVEGLDRRLSNSAQLAKRRTIVHHQPITTAAASGLPEDGTSSAGPSPSNSRSPLGTAPPPSSFSSSSTTTTTTTMIAPTVTPSGHPPPASYPSSSMTNAPYHPTSSPNLKDPSARHPQSRRKFLSELSPLELALVRHLAVLFMHPYVSKLDSYYDAMDPLMVLVDPSRSSLWRHVNDVGDHPPNPSQTISSKVSSTFGVPLDVLVERTGVTAPFGLGPIPLKVPSFLAAAIGTLREKDVTIEGIYRKNGNIRRLRELTETIDRSRGSLSSITALLAKENAVQVAALVKKFLRDLPDPLLSYKIHRLLITICKMEEDVPSMSDFSPGANGNILDGRVHLLHLAYCLLPEENRDVLEVLLAHFRWISQFAELEDRGNKMDLSNMATVVTPNILYSKSKDPSRDESFYANEVVLTLLESQDELSMVPVEIAQVLKDPGFQELTANGLQMSSKELMKRCESYIRPRKSGARPGMSRSGR